jgi:hypothetical protein
MLPAIGAASAALDAIQSLTSPQKGSSQTSNFESALSDLEASFETSSSSPGAGSNGSQISSDNLNALFDAQSLSSGNAAGSPDSSSSTADSSDSDSPSAPAPAAASSTYNSINQLVQSTAIPLGFSISA